jgi:hypothetical protein
MSDETNFLRGSVWVEILAGDPRRWPRALRQWLVLANGRVFIPVGQADAKAATRAGIAYAVHGGQMLVDSGWLLRQRTGDAAAELAEMVKNVRHTGRCQ